MLCPVVALFPSQTRRYGPFPPGERINSITFPSSKILPAVITSGVFACASLSVLVFVLVFKQPPDGPPAGCAESAFSSADRRSHPQQTGNRSRIPKNTAEVIGCYFRFQRK